MLGGLDAVGALGVPAPALAGGVLTWFTLGNRPTRRGADRRVPRAATLLTEAFGRYRPGDEREQVEDRLTEVLACVLAADEQLARALASEADVPVPQGGPREVRTQEACTSGRLDLVLRFFDSRGREAALVWFENKVEADFAEGQPGKYADDLEAQGAPDARRVAVIHPKPQPLAEKLPVSPGRRWRGSWIGSRLRRSFQGRREGWVGHGDPLRYAPKLLSG